MDGWMEHVDKSIRVCKYVFFHLVTSYTVIRLYMKLTKSQTFFRLHCAGTKALFLNKKNYFTLIKRSKIVGDDHIIT